MKEIVFEKPFDCIVCLNGDLPTRDIFAQVVGIPIIAADGVANILIKKNIGFSIVVGDMDSLFSKHRSKLFLSNKIIYDKYQDNCDFEKALDYALSKHFRDVLVFGINGGEYEHSINNLSILSKYSDKLNLCVYTKKRYGFRIKQDISAELVENEIVSIIPFPQATLTTKNLQWELQEFSLKLGAFRRSEE